MTNVHKENLESRANSVAIELGDRLVGDGGFFRSHIDIQIRNEERFYSPVPIVTKIDDTPTVICHPDGFREGWLPAFGSIPTIDDSQIRDMYLVTGLSWAELSLLAENAKTERKYIDDENPQAFAIQRAMRIATEFANKKRLMEQAGELARVGISGIVECVEELDPLEITAINKYRYGLGVAIEFLDLDKSEQEELEIELHKSLRSNVESFKTGLFDFLIRLVDDELSTSLTDEAFEKAFPSLQFAAAIPMNVSYINNK